MVPQDTGYGYLREFVNKYLDQGFLDINREDPFIIRLEKILQANNQCFIVLDLISLKVHFASLTSQDILGVPVGDFDVSTLFRLTYPDDLPRKNLARTKLFRNGQELFIRKGGECYMSACFRTKNSNGTYSDLMYQPYLFFSNVVLETVYALMVLTDITGLGYRRSAYHYYTGSDPSVFRFPDQELLNIGRLFSDRELEIIRYIAAGLNSRQIADKIFLSVNTVNTHRRNILRKTAKANTADLITDLREMGVL